MSNTWLERAERELRLAGLYDKDSEYGGMLPEAVLSLMRAHLGHGHSGYSSQLAIELFSRIANGKALTPPTTNPEEWMHVADPSGTEPGVWQNRRAATCFSNDGGKTYYDLDELDAEGKASRPIHQSKEMKTAVSGSN